jgi:hypothetical protein
LIQTATCLHRHEALYLCQAAHIYACILSGQSVMLDILAVSKDICRSLSRSREDGLEQDQDGRATLTDVGGIVQAITGGCILMRSWALTRRRITRFGYSFLCLSSSGFARRSSTCNPTEHEASGLWKSVGDYPGSEGQVAFRHANTPEVRGAEAQSGPRTWLASAQECGDAPISNYQETIARSSHIISLDLVHVERTRQKEIKLSIKFASA